MCDIKLYQDDCINILKGIKENSIDCAILDPPYKLNKTTGSTLNSGLSNKWNKNLLAGDISANIENNIEFSEWLPYLYNVMKNGSHTYIFSNDKNLSDLVVEAEKVGFKLHNILVWKKNNATPTRWYRKNCEFILFLRKGNAKPINNLSSTQFLEYKNINGKDKIHPTQKPVELITELLLNSTNANDTVIDIFMGSGSTGVVCKNTNRNFIGIEKDEKYFNIAKERIENGQ